MSDQSVYELKSFKEYLPIDEDISEKDRLVYIPETGPNKLIKKIEPALTEEELFNHMKTVSGWNFDNGQEKDYYKHDCIDLLRDVDFQSLSQYGKKTNRIYSEAKKAYLFDSYLRNFLQELLERIEVFIKKSTADAITIGSEEDLYLFENESIYFSAQPHHKKYQKNPNREREVLKTKYFIYQLIKSKMEIPLVKNQLKEYGVVLPWTVFRLMTFGNISSFLVTLQPEYREKVALHINKTLPDSEKIPAKLLLSWCNSLRYLRNLCSHNSSLYKKIHNTPPKVHRNDLQHLNNLGISDNEKKLISFFWAMRHIFSAMSNETQDFWDDKLGQLELESQKRGIDLQHYGFDKNWKETLSF